MTKCPIILLQLLLCWYIQLEDYPIHLYICVIWRPQNLVALEGNDVSVASGASSPYGASSNTLKPNFVQEKKCSVLVDFVTSPYLRLSNPHVFHHTSQEDSAGIHAIKPPTGKDWWDLAESALLIPPFHSNRDEAAGYSHKAKKDIDRNDWRPFLWLFTEIWGMNNF